METRLANVVVDLLTSHNVIPEAHRDIYVYGFELTISFLSSCICIILIGSVLHKVEVTMAFLAVFISLRRFTGGFHAASYLSCQIVTIMTYLLVIYASTHCNVTQTSYYVLLCFGVVILSKYAPITSKAKPLNRQKIKSNHNKSVITFLVYNLLGYILLQCQKLTSLSNSVFFSLVAVLTLLVIGIYKERRGGYDPKS